MGKTTRKYTGKRAKYSVEQDAGTMAVNAAGDGGVVIVPPANIQGMRKVKHLEISMAMTQTPNVYCFWAIVYVPAGTTPSTIAVDSGAMYEPNQYVMNCGVFDFDGGPLRIRSPVARNLNSGDSIYLVVKTSSSITGFRYCTRYAITLN